MKVHILERILFFVIACTIVFAGLCLYIYLVYIYQSHWPHVLASHLRDGTRPTASSICHARWTPIESSQQLDREQSATFQSHASFVLAAGAAGELETSRFLLSLQDRHASGVVFFDQSASTSPAAAAAFIKVKVEAIYESEEALRAETRTICGLRQSRGQYGICVIVAAVPRHEFSVRDNITVKNTVWLPGPRVADAHVPQSQRVVGDSPPHDSAFPSQLSTPLMNATIEMDTAQINTLHRYVRGKFNDVPLSLEPAAAAGPNITVGIPTYINNNGPPLSIILTTTDAQTVRRIHSAESKSDGFFRVSAHLLNGNPPVIRFFGQARGKTLDLGVSSTSGCSPGTVPLSCIWAPFELMATMIGPSVDAEVEIEEPTGCMKSRIVRHGVCLIQDVE